MEKVNMTDVQYEEDIEQILTDVYNNTYDDVRRYIISKCRDIEDVGDLIQNVYLSFYRALKTNKNILNPKRYLIKTAKHEVYKHYGRIAVLKNNIPVFSTSDNEDFTKVEKKLQIEEDFDKNIFCDEIWSYIKKEDVLTNKIFILYFEEDMKIKDISELLKVGESTVKNRLYRTLKKINKFIDLGRL